MWCGVVVWVGSGWRWVRVLGGVGWGVAVAWRWWWRKRWVLLGGNGIGADGMEWDGVGWDGMGGDRMGGNGMEEDRIAT